MTKRRSIFLMLVPSWEFTLLPYLPQNSQLGQSIKMYHLKFERNKLNLIDDEIFSFREFIWTS